MHFESSDLKFHSLSLEFNAETAFPIKGLTYKSIPILQNDSCLSCRKKIDSIKSNVKNKNYTFISANDNSNLIEKFDAFKNVQFNDSHWAYSFYLNDSNEINLHNGNNPISKDILEKVLKTFDPSIKGIDALTKNSTSKDAGYLVEFVNGDEVQLMLQKAILTLPEKQRLVFNMKYFDGITYEEMEAILGTTVGALKASYHIAVKKIEKYFEQNG